MQRLHLSLQLCAIPQTLYCKKNDVKRHSPVFSIKPFLPKSRNGVELGREAAERANAKRPPLHERTARANLAQNPRILRYSTFI
jgi:tRNA (Thr-GGU) A37 N-methylase